MRRPCTGAALAAVALCAAAGLAAPTPVGADAASPAPPAWRVERQGIEVEATLAPLEEGAALAEGTAVAVRFSVRDTTSGEPLSGLYPAAWMDRLPAGSERQPDECKKKVEAFLGGSLLAEPEVNLNVYYVLALNEDASISVVDPIFGFGGSKLLTTVPLAAPGEDWALSPAGDTLWVSQPAAGEVAMIDTARWRVVESVPVGPRPVEVALSADGRHLWVADEGDGETPASVVAIDARSRRVAARLDAGPGPLHLAASDDGRWVVATAGAAGTATVFDARRLEPVARVELGGRPVAVAWSSAAGAAFASLAEGEVVAVDPAGAVRARAAAEPGLGRISFAPGGRLGFVVNPRENLVHIVDAASGRIIQTADVLRAPDRVAFSDELAYVRHAGSELVLMIPLDTVGTPGAPVPIVDFPGGQRPFGAPGTVPSPAASIVQAPGATAVLVANPADGVIYYYKEGMAAPMGNFRNYGRQPRAVLAVDRSLRETAPGTYETAVDLRRPGLYDLALYLDAPPMVYCLPFEVAADPVRERERLAGRLVIEPAGSGARPPALTVGEESRLRFRLRDPATGELRADLPDVEVLTFATGGTWQRRASAVPGPDATYSIPLTPPSPGLYFVFVSSVSAGVPVERSSPLHLRAHAPASAAVPEEGSR